MEKHRKFVENIIKPFGLSFQSKESRQNEDSLEKIAIKEHKAFSYKMLSVATENFNPKNKLGEGGFGPVYKGVLMDGREIAVKKLSSGSKQGSKEFKNEALLLSRVQHRNVVNLYGYCADTIDGPNGQQQQEKLLVYEYVHHESLDKILFKKKGELNWNQRFNIIVGIARGLLYLHEDAPDTIIHRDIKAGNILLNERWEPKIADFGMARLYPEGQTHILTRVAGTNGYMAPEYVMNGQLSTKADVFSYGVLVLELISGHKSSTFIPDLGCQSLLEWAWRLHRKGQSLEILDATLASTASADQVVMCVQVGLLCVQAEPKLRPDMSRVVVLLSKKPGATAPVEPARPGFSVSTHRSSRGGRNSGSGSGTTSSVANSSSGSRSTTQTASKTNTL